MSQPQGVSEPNTQMLPNFDEWDGPYGLRCFGDCCEPVIPDGATVIIDHRDTFGAGDFVALWVAKRDGNIEAIVKRLLLNLAPWARFPHRVQGIENVTPLLVVETLNPPRQLQIDLSRVYAVHRVIGWAPPRPEVPIGANVDLDAVTWFGKSGKRRLKKRGGVIA